MKLEDVLESLVHKLNRKNYNIGAQRGIMVNPTTVLIDNKTYNAIVATQVNTTPGTKVWCQLANAHTAIVIGA